MFIETEATADPARMRFLPGRAVMAEGTLEMRGRAEAAASPLAERLFAIPEIAGVFLDGDSIIVTKGSGDWRQLRPVILGAIMDHFMSGAPVLRRAEPDRAEAVPPPAPAAAEAAGAVDEDVERIREALRQVIDPELGCNIVDLGLVYDIEIEKAGTVRITMTTTTPGCPATNYLKGGAGESVSALPGIEFVEVKLTYDPRWGPEMMSPEAKAQFGITDGGRW